MKMRKLLSLLLTLCVILSCAPIGARAAHVDSGSSGSTHWSLDGQGTLTIWGSGEMEGAYQWSDYGATIKQVIIEDGITSIESYAFKECTRLEQISIPNSVTRIESWAFNACTSLAEITIPESMIEICYAAFVDCIRLENVIIPGSVVKIDTYAFSGCISLADVIISEGVAEIGSFAFGNCTNLGSVTIPDSVTDIGDFAFSECTNLTSVTIGAGTEFILGGAFKNCANLADVYFLGDAPVFEGIFSGVTATAHYPGYNGTWTEDVLLDYYGNITWEPYYYTGSRLAGSNRFETAVMVADQLKQTLGVEKFDAVILANGYNFADALSGSYLAAVKNAPILLTWNGSEQYHYLNEYTVDYVKANLAEGGTVYILGGTSAVPETVDAMLAGYNVVRMDGVNRFETNIMILEEAGVTEGQEILVCTSTNFADSLSASATGLPILLVWNEGGKLFDIQTEYLAGISGKNSFCILGGENAVSAALASTAGTYGDVTRLAGANRFETSVLVAEKYFPDAESAVLAYAWDFPDGLCGGVLAYAQDCPLILTMNCYEAAAAEYVAERGIRQGTILGGTGLICDDAVDAVFGGSTPGHVYSHSIVEPTTSAGGYTIHTCTKCGHSYKDTYTDKLPDDSWKDAYLEHITEGTEDIPTDIATYYLLYIDEDQIPELWIDYGYTFAGCNLAVYADRGINSYYFSAGGLYYQSFENIFVHRYGRQGWYGDNVYRLNNGARELLASGTYQSQTDENGYPNYEVFDYFWGEEPVSEAQYNQAIAEYIDLEACEMPYYNAQSFTYEEILEYLAN